MSAEPPAAPSPAVGDGSETEAGLRAGVIVPAAPLLLAEASPAQPAAVAEAVASLRADVDAALTSLPSLDATLIVGSGSPGVRNDARAGLRPLGVAAADHELQVATHLIGDVTRVTRFPLVSGEPLPVNLAVLVLLLERAGHGAPVLPVTVDAATEASTLHHVGASLAQASARSGASVSIVATGDLAATLTVGSPGYVAENAGLWDRRAADAVAEVDLAALAGLGPEEAARVQATSWAPLNVMLAAAQAAGLPLPVVRYHAPRGVGQLVARFGVDRIVH